MGSQGGGRCRGLVGRGGRGGEGGGGRVRAKGKR